MCTRRGARRRCPLSLPHLAGPAEPAPRAGSGFASWRSLLSALGDRVADELDSANLYRRVPASACGLREPEAPGAPGRPVAPRHRRCVRRASPTWAPLNTRVHAPPCCSDALLGEVQREAENGRLLRLLMKLCYICERPELGGDSQWAETGDRRGGRGGALPRTAPYGFASARGADAAPPCVAHSMRCSPWADVAGPKTACLCPPCPCMCPPQAPPSPLQIPAFSCLAHS